jgi:hypothetical protein
MTNQFILLKRFCEQHLHLLLAVITISISIIATAYFYFHGLETLSNYDAMARLNLTRKLIDSLTPGVGQFGAIWLPFPQVLMLPFIWNNFLWHTGLAGSIISEAAFIAGALYLQKTAFFITKSIKASLVVWFMFVTNINILLFQSMPMSESFFLFCIIMVLYFLTKWVMTHDIVAFLSTAFFVMIGTLTRYEGYFILVGALCAVCIELVLLYWKKKNFSKIEGMILVFLTIAGYGIFLWCLYCFIFFKDPLHWLHLYSGNNGDGSIIPSQNSHKGILESFTVYSEITIWISGLLNSFLGIAGFLALVGSLTSIMRKKKKVNIYLPLFIITVVLFPMLIYGYQKGYIPPVVYENITLQHILSKSFNIYLYGDPDAPNIRYGIIMVPFIALFTGFLIGKRKVLVGIAIILICFQLFTNFFTPLLLQFSVPRASHYVALPSAAWLKEHYTGGLILTSATTNENFMFQTGLPYHDFIYEGTQHYWKNSLTNPARYATWVMDQNLVRGDLIYDTLSPSASTILQKKFKLVYSDREHYYIYHLVSR